MTTIHKSEINISKKYKISVISCGPYIYFNNVRAVTLQLWILTDRHQMAKDVTRFNVGSSTERPQIAGDETTHNSDSWKRR